MKLGEACFLKSGKNITAKEIYVSPKDNLYPCYGGNGLRGYVDKYNYEGDYNLIGRQGALCGNINRVNGKFYATEHAVVVTPLISLDIDWLYFALVGMDLNQYHTGAAQPGLNIDILNNLEIDVPIIGEQIAQATVLNKINGMIRNRKRELEKLDDLIKARFVEMFGDLHYNPKGWDIKSFDELTILITDGEHATPRRVEQGIYLLSARNVHNHSLQLADVDYIDEEEYERIAKRIIPQEGDVLISCSGTVGRCCSVPAGIKFQMVRSAALLRFKDSINPVFAEYMITSDYIQEQINSSKTASSQANLFQGKIAKLKGFVPPIELQNEFLNFVAQVDKSKSHKKTNYKTNNKLAS